MTLTADCRGPWTFQPASLLDTPTDPEQDQLVRAYTAAASVLDRVFHACEAIIGPRVSTRSIDQCVRQALRDHGAQSSFKGDRGYPCYSTTSVNDEVINALPSRRKLRDGDLLKLQIGVQSHGVGLYQGWTYSIGIQSERSTALCLAGREALWSAISAATEGNRVLDVSRAIQETLDHHGVAPTREFVGHMFGAAGREEPKIPCWCNEQSPGIDHLLRKGQLLSVVVIAHEGSLAFRQASDRWGCVATDGSLSVHYSHVVCVCSGVPTVLTRDRPDIL